MKSHHRFILLLILLKLSGIQYVTSQYIEVPESINDNSYTTLSLNGEWLFDPDPDEELPRFDMEEMKSIDVPGEWKMQGFDVEPKEQALYMRKFNIPKNWDDKNVILRCDAIFSESEIWINDKKVGNHLGGITAFEFDVTSFINKGKENTIVIGVTSQSLADELMSGSSYAGHPLGGIIRKIYLFAVPESFLGNLNLVTNFDEEYINSELILKADFHNPSGKRRNGILNIKLQDPDGNFVKLSNSEHEIVFERGQSKINKNITVNVKNPLKWSAEYPFLYKLHLSYASDSDEELLIKKIGFREIEIRGNQVFLNNKAIKLRGINRHEAHPLLGRSLNEELWMKDALLYKQANMNFIRTAHYPPGEEFIEACDSIGLMVELENPICWVGWQDSARWEETHPDAAMIYNYIEQVSRENIHFFGNHPSIIIWSMANESQWGPLWSRLLDYFQDTDPSRPVIFHDQAIGNWNNKGSTAPIANKHYPGPSRPEEVDDFPRPILFGEYCHLNCYNKTEIVTDPGIRDTWGNILSPMWELVYDSKASLGAAIWSGVDDVFLLPDGNVVGYGKWGPLDGWRRKKPEYHHIKKTYSPVIFTSLDSVGPESNESFKFRVENRYTYTDLKECKIYWVNSESDSGKIDLELPPGKETVFELNLDPSYFIDNELNIKVYSPHRYLVSQTPVRFGEVDPKEDGFLRVESSKLELDSTGIEYFIKGEGFSWVIDRSSGEISGGIGNNNIIEGLELCMVPLHTGRLITDYECDLPPFNNIYKEPRLRELSIEEKKDTINLTLEILYDYAAGEMELAFTSTGELIAEYDFLSNIDLKPRQYGLLFECDRSVENLEWYRKGLWLEYPDDHIGRIHGKAVPFPNGDYKDICVGSPENKWYHDANKLGSNDFRSTKENIYWSSMTDEDNIGVVVYGEGKKSFRSFVENDRVKFLVADYNTGGADKFMNSHYSDKRESVDRDDTISGTTRIVLVKGRK